MECAYWDLMILCGLEIDTTSLHAHISYEMCCISTRCHNAQGLSMNRGTSDLIFVIRF